MKKASLIAIITSIMIIAASVLCFAEGGFSLKESYPADGAKNTSIENLGVKLTFTKPMNDEAVKAANADKFAIYDEDGNAIPIKVLFSDDKEGLVLVLADTDADVGDGKKFMAKNNSVYKLVISGELIDNDGDVLGEDVTITFKTYNQKVNNTINMVMMMVMFGGIMFLSMRQNNAKEEEEAAKETPKEAFNPYKEAKKTGKSVEEVMEEQAKKEAKEAKKKARKKKSAVEEVPEKKIENCAKYLNNVYHVHAPAPINKADRSVEALKVLRKAESKKSKSTTTKKK